MRKFAEELRYELEDPSKHAFAMTFGYAIALILGELLTSLILEAVLLGINTGMEELDLLIGRIVGGIIVFAVITALVVSFAWWLVQFLRDIKLAIEDGWRC